MRTTPKQHINIHMPCSNQQTIRVTRRNDRVAMSEANAEGAVGDHFRESEVGGLGVEIAFDDLQIWGDGAEVVVGFFVG